MKLVTHVATALSLSALIAILLRVQCGYVALAMYGVAVYASQHTLDMLGHTWVTYRGRRYPKRNRLHSLPGVVALGLLWGLPLATHGCWQLVAGVVAGTLLHYLEDAVTEAGVYIGKKRVRLPVRISYDNPFANMLAVSLTLAALLVVLGLYWCELPQPLLLYSLAAALYSLLAMLSL